MRKFWHGICILKLDNLLCGENMQISDLNTNLIQALGSKSVAKAETEEKKSAFVGLLDIKNDKQSVVSLGEEAKYVAVESYRKEHLAVDVKEADSSDNRSSAPKEKSENSQVYEKEKVSANDNHSKSDKVEYDNENRETSDSLVTTENDVVEKTVSSPVLDVEDAVVLDEAVSGLVLSTPVNQIEPEIKEDANVLLSEINCETDIVANAEECIDSINTVPTMTIGEPVDVVVQNNSVVTEGETIIPEEAPVELEKMISENVDKPSDIIDNDLTLETEVALQDKPIVESSNTSIQEAKIAELLPEETKVVLKVDVNKDEVNTLKSQPVVASIIDNADVDNIEIIDDNAVQLPDTELQLVENQKPEAQVAVATNVVEEVKVADVIVKESKSITEVSNVASNAVAVSDPVANTVKINSQSNINDSFKDIYNKGISREVAEQIKVNITQSAIKGIDKVEIKLNPADLGQLEIKMQIGKDGRLQAHIVASNAETLDLLQKDLSSLKDAFSNAGYQTDDGSFSFSYRGEEQNNNEREQLRNFIGEIIAQDVAEELAANNDYISVDGVNIRV